MRPSATLQHQVLSIIIYSYLLAILWICNRDFADPFEDDYLSTWAETGEDYYTREEHLEDHEHEHYEDDYLDDFGEVPPREMDEKYLIAYIFTGLPR